jgi:hypothetical protein
MRWETAEPPGAGDAQGSQPARRRAPQEPSVEEHLGPVSFTREVKDDGRTLIVYRRSGERRDG